MCFPRPAQVTQLTSVLSHATAAGATASWYFVTRERDTAGAALKRALTTSFGSLCLASLCPVPASATSRPRVPQHAECAPDCCAERPGLTAGGGAQGSLVVSATNIVTLIMRNAAARRA